MDKQIVPTVLITGASAGIGCALAVEYARAGARVLGVGRRPFPAALAGHMAPEDYCAVDLRRSEASAAKHQCAGGLPRAYAYGARPPLQSR